MPTKHNTATLRWQMEPSAPLKRAISRTMLLALVVGDVLGAGVDALVGEVGGRVGGPIS